MATVNIYDMADTWNAGGTTFTSIKMNVTDTASAAASLLMDLQVGGVSKFSVSKSGNLLVGSAIGSAGTITFNSYGSAVLGVDAGGTGVWAQKDLHVSDDRYLGFYNGGTGQSLARIYYVGSGILGLRGAGSTTGGALSFIEQTAPSAPAANGCYIYAQDNGAGKTQLMARFASGAAQQVAIEP